MNPALNPSPEVLAAVSEEFGTIQKVTTIGILANMNIIETETQKIVTKSMDYFRLPQKMAALFNALKQADIPCPELLKYIGLPDRWYALFGYVEGYNPGMNDPKWDTTWRSAFDLLRRLRDLTGILPEWDLESIWLDRFAKFPHHCPSSRDLLEVLMCSLLSGNRTLAHGDFAPQNFLSTPHGLLLVDWEEVGSASAGFDAGWILALNRIGAGPRRPQTSLFQQLAALGFPENNLHWFEGLGLLRLFYRAWTLPIEPDQRRTLLGKIGSAVSRYCTQHQGFLFGR